MSSILALRISRLGDLLFTTPALQLLRRRFPEATLDVLTSTSTVAALRGLPFLDAVHGIPAKALDVRALAWCLTRRLARRYDTVVSFSLREQHMWLAASLGAGRVVPDGPRDRGFRAPPLRPYRVVLLDPSTRAVQWHLVPDCRDPAENHRPHMVLDHCRRVAPLTGELEGEPPPLAVHRSDRDRTRVKGRLKRLGLGPGESYVVMHPGFHGVRRGRALEESGRRSWLAERWVALSRLLAADGRAVVLTSGTRTEQKQTAEISRAAGAGTFSFGWATVPELAALYEGAELFVGVDSGPMHVAAAVDTPIVALFGSSRAELTGPWIDPERARIVRLNLPCSPCKGRHVSCPLNQCMRLTQAEDVAGAIADLTSRSPPGRGMR